MKCLGQVLLVLTMGLLCCIQVEAKQENAIVKSYRQAIAADPKDVIAHYNLGLSLYQQGKFNEARKMLERSVKINHGDKAAHTQVDGLAYQLLGSIYLTALKNPRQAIAAFEKSIVYYPGDAESLYLLGLAYMDVHDVQQAITSLQKAAQIGKSQANQRNNVYDAYLQLGRLYAQQKELPLSIQAYQSALELNPKGKEALANLALVYHQQNDSKRTIDQLEKLIKLDKKHFNAYYLLGLHYFKQKKYDSMEKAYKQAIKLKPDLAEAHYNLGMAYFLQTRYDLAIQALKKVVALNPRDADAYNLLGQSQQRGIEMYLQEGMTNLAQEQLPEAIEAFSKVLKIDPNHHKAKVYLADSQQRLKKLLSDNLEEADKLYAKGKLELAYQKYDQALRLNSNSERAKDGLAKTKGKIDKLLAVQVEKGKNAQRQGDLFEAIHFYQSALRLKNNYKPARQALAAAKRQITTGMDQTYQKAKQDAETGHYERAVNNIKKLLERAKKIGDSSREKKYLRLITKTNSQRKELVDRYLQLAKNALNAGNQVGAKTNLTQLLDIEPQNQEANQLIMKLTGSKSKAKVTAERIKATYYRGVDFYVNGKIEEAIREWQKVVALDPENDDAKVNIKRARIKLEAIRKLTGG